MPVKPINNISTGAKATISDVAEALGISKTTVSRAISGKGRIGEETRRRVMEYIEKVDYKPNPLAKGLANSKTYNIAWVIPGDSNTLDLPFFQRCMNGISEIAAQRDYDLLLSTTIGDDISHLMRIVNNQKVDGVILGRTMVEDKSIEFLKSKGIPFVVIGSFDDDDVIQVDNDHVNACRELTSFLLMKGFNKLALIGGGEDQVVNNLRRSGYENAVDECQIAGKTGLVYMNNRTNMEVERAVEEAVKNNVDCLVCMDDGICYVALEKLRKEGLSVPQDIRIASFYNSRVLENNSPAITSLKYDPRELGYVAGKTLFSILDSETHNSKTMLGYEVALKESTR